MFQDQVYINTVLMDVLLFRHMHALLSDALVFLFKLRIDNLYVVQVNPSFLVIHLLLMHYLLI